MGRENDVKNRWNLIDYGDVVVHILHQDERDTYAIENFGTMHSAFQEKPGCKNQKHTQNTKILRDN